MGMWLAVSLMTALAATPTPLGRDPVARGASHRRTTDTSMDRVWTGGNPGGLRSDRSTPVRNPPGRAEGRQGSERRVGTDPALDGQAPGNRTRVALAPAAQRQDAQGPRPRTRPPARDPSLGQDSATGFLVAGAVLTGLSTWASGMVASRYLDSTDATRQQMGRVLPIPFAGPIAAAGIGSREQRYLATLGMVQGAGLSFLTIGAVSLSRRRRLKRFDHPPARNHSTGVLALTQGVMWLSITWGMTFGFSRARASDGDAFARRLQVPLVGGFFAAPLAPNYTRGYLGLTSSAVQIASASAIVFGAVVLGKRRNTKQLSVVPVPTRDGAQLVAAIRF